MILQDLINNFRSARVPFQNIFIDENLVLLKGWLSFKQLIITKCPLFGIKFFVSCDEKLTIL